MKAIGFTGKAELTDAHCFVEFEQETPLAEEHDVLVKVIAVSVNPIDSKIRKNLIGRQSTPVVLGRDASGIVEAVGPKVTLFKPGDKVFYSGNLKKSGSNAMFQLVDERIAGPHPKNLSFAEAAAMPLTSLTAWESLFDRLKINPKVDSQKNILIIAGAGGVGSIAIQIAKKIAGLNVTATASRTESVVWCKKMGADIVIDHYNLAGEYENRKMAAPDYILCCSPTDAYFNQMAQLIAPQGMICLLVDTTRDHNLLPLKIKSAGLVWEFMSTRPIYQTKDMIKQYTYLSEISNLLDKGILKSTLRHNLGRITAANIIKAHRLIESSQTIGKIVLENF